MTLACFGTTSLKGNVYGSTLLYGAAGRPLVVESFDQTRSLTVSGVSRPPVRRRVLFHAVQIFFVNEPRACA